MQADPFVWILPASAALSIAVTLILLSASEYDSLMEPIGLILGVVGIVIGLIIAHSQKKQGERIGKLVGGVDAQTRRITETLEEIRRVDREARARDNRRKDYHLFFIRSQVTRVMRMVARRARRIQRHIIENPTATLEQWQQEREQVRRRGAHTRRSMEFVRGHFDAIDDLMMDHTLADDVNTDLENIARLLTAIHDLQDPTEQQSQHQEQLIRLLRELSSDAFERLDNQLRRIADEVPQMEVEGGGGEGQE